MSQASLNVHFQEKFQDYCFLKYLKFLAKTIVLWLLLTSDKFGSVFSIVFRNSRKPEHNENKVSHVAL
jgi:hypothetical protein